MESLSADGKTHGHKRIKQHLSCFRSQKNRISVCIRIRLRLYFCVRIQTGFIQTENCTDTDDQEAPESEFVLRGTMVVRPLHTTDDQNRESVIEDIDSRWPASGLKQFKE